MFISPLLAILFTSICSQSVGCIFVFFVVSFAVQPLLSFSSVQFSHSVVSDSLRPHGLQDPRLLYHQLPEITQTHVHRVNPTISSSVIPFSTRLQSFPASIRVFSNESVLCIRRPKYWHFSFSINPYSEYLGLITFKV